MASGVTRPLLKLARHFDVHVQRAAAVAIAGLALGKCTVRTRRKSR